MTLTIRPARKNDHNEILNILKGLDLYYSGLKLKDFWVAEDQGRIVGVVQLEEFPNFLFLGSLGVPAEKQNQGVGKVLMGQVLSKAKKDVYLYTVIPKFFQRFNFKIATEKPVDIPTKERYECEFCHTDRCVTMVKHVT